ncbi:MAG: SDR family NAD(P)-dependent oxidoreductase [Alphaproteobacteria bacterium]|nr:SDR family NAD(P)-dependent oxidoreductase [Alphaproteobacteria bacterium]
MVIVTGGNGGIGQGIVDVFSEHNAHVVVADFAASLNARSSLGAGELVDIRTDITDRASIDAMVAQVMDRFGRIDVLVNNTGRG